MKKVTRQKEEDRPSQRGVNNMFEGPAVNQKHMEYSDITGFCHGRNGGRWEVFARVEAGEGLGALNATFRS